MVADEYVDRNVLLAALPETTLAQWLPLLELVDLPVGFVVYESGVTLDYVYFPTSAIVSLMVILEDGASSEVAVVGREGIVGVSVFMGGSSMPQQAVVQSAGKGYRLRAKVMLDECHRVGPVLQLFLRYTLALAAQMTQLSVCNRHHLIDQQLCRLLLLRLDRAQDTTLHLTQESIANLLGVRRGGVTTAAVQLQTAGVIRYARGRVTVVDRHALEARCCECYDVVRREYDRLLPGPTKSGDDAPGWRQSIIDSSTVQLTKTSGDEARAPRIAAKA